MSSTTIYLPETMKQIDRTAIETLGVSSVLLMENAARAVADRVRAQLRPDAGTICVLCGTGNNGGDGIAAARFLRQEGYHVRCFLFGEPEKLTPDARCMADRLQASGGTLEYCPAWSLPEQPALIIDALFGFSFRGALGGEYLAAARWANASGVPVVACDIPSGVDPATGDVRSEAIRATETVTFTACKTGLLLPPGSEYVGRLTVAPIGIPRAACRIKPEAELCSEALARACFPRRKRNTHKGDYGKVLLLCGSVGYTGAAALSARAALRAGSGLVYLGVPEPVYPILAAKLDEAIVFPLPAEDGRLSEASLSEILPRLRQMDACLIGPGLGRSEAVERVALGVLQAAACPVAVDADGINALSAHMDVLRSVSAPLVLTPHDGELQRLGCTPRPAERLDAAKQFAAQHSLTLLLKGYRTVIAGLGRAYVNATGNPGMATGGSGDVLAGVLVSLLGRGIAPPEAAAAAAWLHGSAGDRAAELLGEYAMLPGDLVQTLAQILKDLE